MELYRAGEITAIEPMKKFDVSDVVQAFRYFGLSTRVGKVAVSFEKPDSEIQASKVFSKLFFIANKLRSFQ
jgi:hypothetical protein